MEYNLKELVRKDGDPFEMKDVSLEEQ